MKLKLVAAFSALAIPVLAHTDQSSPQPAVSKPTRADAQKIESTYGEGGQAIYETHEQIMARIEATIDTLINEFAEAWTHSQGIGHPKYGAP